MEISASPRYFLGDVNGDGKVDVEDVRLLAKLKNGNGRKWNDDQLKAGDFNGNGPPMAGYDHRDDLWMIIYMIG